MKTSNVYLMFSSNHMINNMAAGRIPSAITKPSLTDVTVDKSGRIMNATVCTTVGGEGQTADTAPVVLLFILQMCHIIITALPCRLCIFNNYYKKLPKSKCFKKCKTEKILRY